MRIVTGARPAAATRITPPLGQKRIVEVAGRTRSKLEPIRLAAWWSCRGAASAPDGTAVPWCDRPPDSNLIGLAMAVENIEHYLKGSPTHVVAGLKK